MEPEVWRRRRRQILKRRREEAEWLVQSKGFQPKIMYKNFVYRLRRSGMTSAGETFYFHCDKGRRRDHLNPKKKITVCRVYLHAFKDSEGNFVLKNKPKSYGHTCVTSSAKMARMKLRAAVQDVVRSTRKTPIEVMQQAARIYNLEVRESAATSATALSTHRYDYRPTLVEEMTHRWASETSRVKYIRNVRHEKQTSDMTEEELVQTAEQAARRIIDGPTYFRPLELSPANVTSLSAVSQHYLDWDFFPYVHTFVSPGDIFDLTNQVKKVPLEKADSALSKPISKRCEGIRTKIVGPVAVRT